MVLNMVRVLITFKIGIFFPLVIKATVGLYSFLEC